MLRDAGFETVRAKTFLLEQLSPLTADQHLYLSELLASWRADEALREALESDDRAALNALTDPTSPDYALTRADFYLLDGRRFTLGTGSGNPQLAGRGVINSAARLPAL